MTARRKLQWRRRSETLEFEREGSRLRITIGYFENEIGEVFMNADRVNSSLDALISDAAIIVSLCLQWGASLQEITRALKRDARGAASSPIGAALDVIAELAVAP